jgi:hypothetical protein
MKGNVVIFKFSHFQILKEKMTSTDILNKLESGQNDIAIFFDGLDDKIFFDGTDERWGPAQHLAHLTFTHKRVARGFVAKDLLPEYSGEPKNYDEVVANYLAALQRASSGGFLANNPFAAKSESTDKKAVIEEFVQTTKGLRDAARLWSEAELDTKGMQHPLIGMLSVREMLLFMIYHNQHHLSGVQKIITKSEN